MKLLVLLVALSVLPVWASHYWVLRDNSVDSALVKNYLTNVIDKARVQVYQLKSGVKFTDLPKALISKIKPIDLKTQLSHKTYFVRTKASGSEKVFNLVSALTVDDYKKTLEWVTSFGPRSTSASRQGIMDKLVEYGYQPVEDYNIEAFKLGQTEPEKFVILEAHMDTVKRTMGADDNGSGTAALLEAARILKDVPTKYSILFLVTEDEEIGLRGSRYKVKKLKESNKLKDLVFVANMDMISYRENDRFDIETEPEFKSLARWVAQQALTYTSLEPNILLNAWGADHVPFINAGVPTVLTIEHWNNHNPCYHRPCDTLDLVDWEFASEIARLNIALVALKAELI